MLIAFVLAGEALGKCRVMFVVCMGRFPTRLGPFGCVRLNRTHFGPHEVDKLFPRNQDGSGYEKQVFRWNRSLVRKEVRVCPLEALELAGMRWF